MNNTNKTVYYSLLLGLSSLCWPLKADPWTSFPGTKARGMGTAFVALANDPSAAWHNPAGLYQMFGTNLSIETGNAPKYETSQEFHEFRLPGGEVEFLMANSWIESGEDNNSSFVSLNHGDGKTFGVGLYYYEPYFINYLANSKAYAAQDIGLTRGFVKEKVNITGLGYSADLYSTETRKWFSNLYYGFTIEYVKNSTDGTRFEHISGLTNYDRVRFTSIDVAEGWSGSTGFMSTLYKGHSGEVLSPTIKLAGVYRFSTFSEARPPELEIDGFVVKDDIGSLFNSKPPSWDVGLSASKINLTSAPGFGLLSMSMSYQIGETTFDSILTDMDYRKKAFGASLRLTREKGTFFQQFELRVGSYSEVSDSPLNTVLNSQQLISNETGNRVNHDLGMAYPDVAGLTWGFQVAMSNGLLFEFASEKRTLERAYSCFDNGPYSAADCKARDLSSRYWTGAIRYHF